MDNFIQTIQSTLGDTILNIGFAIIILIVGLIVINWVLKLLKKAVEHSKIDPTLKPFINSFSSISLKIILFVTIYQMFDSGTTSIVAIIGAASFAIGLAFQGALSNFAGGVLILSLKPFHIGDYISAQGHEGIVEAIHVFNTVIVSLDNKVISIPNGQLSNTSIINFTEKPTRRVDLSFGVAYGSDLKLVVTLLEQVTKEHALILQDPAPFIKLAEHGDSSLIYTVRSWCNTGDYWTVYFDVINNVKTIFDENNIGIPFPQMDVHLDK